MRARVAYVVVAAAAVAVIAAAYVWLALDNARTMTP